MKKVSNGASASLRIQLKPDWSGGTLVRRRLALGAAQETDTLQKLLLFWNSSTTTVVGGECYTRQQTRQTVWASKQ